jgi:hypothetical protein
VTGEIVLVTRLPPCPAEPAEPAEPVPALPPTPPCAPPTVIDIDVTPAGTVNVVVPTDVKLTVVVADAGWVRIGDVTTPAVATKTTTAIALSRDCHNLIRSVADLLGATARSDRIRRMGREPAGYTWPNKDRTRPGDVAAISPRLVARCPTVNPRYAAVNAVPKRHYNKTPWSKAVNGRSRGSSMQRSRVRSSSSPRAITWKRR